MERTWMPTVAGILSIVAGGISLLGSTLAGIGVAIFFTSAYYGPRNQFFPEATAWAFVFLPYFIISALAVAGGVFALRRRIWGLALAGSICAFLTGWAWALGVAAIVLTGMSKREFDRLNPVQPQPPSTVPAPPPPSAPPQT
jgi:hypothetical protein